MRSKQFEEGDMGEKNICEYCWHEYHGVVPASGLAMPTDSLTRAEREKNLCSAQIDSAHTCNCNGRAQWFSFRVGSYEEAERLAPQIEAAGYDVYQFSGDRIAVQPVDAEGKKADFFMTAFTETLPPVASYEEFRQRVGL